jgi:hypothetical protein
MQNKFTSASTILISVVDGSEGKIMDGGTSVLLLFIRKGRELRVLLQLHFVFLLFKNVCPKFNVPSEYQCEAQIVDKEELDSEDEMRLDFLKYKKHILQAPTLDPI